MNNTEYTYIRDISSPNIGPKLWSDITFINFEKRRYINETPINVQELNILHENGYKAVDTALADSVMKLNSMEGCKTRYCCSGHPGKFNEGYIIFEKIFESLSEQIDKLKYWKREASLDADQLHLIRLGMSGVPCNEATLWLKALLEIAEMGCLPQRNLFDEYRIESTYKGRSPHKQEIRHIYPVQKTREPE